MENNENSNGKQSADSVAVFFKGLLNFFHIRFVKKKPTPEERTQAIHEKVRILRKKPEALDDLAIELFLRLVGIFFTIPDNTRNDAKFADASKEFLALREFIDAQLGSADGKNFAKYEMSDYVHNLHLLLVEVVNLDYLEANIHNVREEYRTHVGEITFRIYTLSKSFEFLDKYWHADPIDPQFLAIKDIYEHKLRIDYGNLLNEIRKAKLYEIHIEGTRRYLIKKVFNVFVSLLSVPVIATVLYIVYYRQIVTNHNGELFIGFSGFVVICAAAIAGATGSLMSVILRIQGVRDNTQLAQNIFAFKYSKTTVQIAPVTGMIFAIILTLIIYGGFIAGSVFPKIGPSWAALLTDGNELPKLLVWSFIAGFSERLIPDMVDRLSDKARKADEKLAN